MLALLRDLEHLCSLRDRVAQDSALVGLVYRSTRNLIDTVRLVRLVGEEGDLRCLVRAEHGCLGDTGVGSQSWSDWSDLPPITDFSARNAAYAQGAAVTAGVAPCTTVIPLGSARPATNYLEYESHQVLPADLQSELDAIVGIYLNLESLLDYGEKDALTELLNRKSFDATFLNAVMREADDALEHPADRRAQFPLRTYWIAVLDIDHFKRVNDSFGHLIGDEVLLLMARLMRSSFRFNDRLYRFGGEEFVILMQCAGHDDAVSALQRLRHKVEHYDFPQVGAMTVSIGFAPLTGDDTPSAAFGRADKAVYYAKAHGRNQVCSYLQLVAAGELVEEVAAAGEADFF